MQPFANKKKGKGQLVGKDAFAKRMEFEKLVANLSARFVALLPERVDDEVNSALRELLDFFRIDRISLLRLMSDKVSWQVSHNADAEGISPYPVASPMPVSLYPYFTRKLMEREFLLFSTLDHLPPDAAVDIESLKAWNIRSGLYIPIAALRSAEYTLGICSARNNRACSEEYIPRLRLLGELFVNALERSKAEQRVRESEERLNLASSAAQAGLWIMEADKSVVWATPKFRELFHFSLDEEVPLERFLAAVHSKDLNSVRKAIDRSLKKQEPLDIEFRILDLDGTVRWITFRGSPFPGTPENPERLMGASIDLTERKRLEAELRERLNEIESLKLQLEKENLYLREEIKMEQGIQNIVGSSEVLQYVFFKIRQVAPTDATVLVLGETGTGKGLVAHAIHELSARRDRPMITVNCAALPANLIESELFGREKGAFTGAHARQEGRFEVAHGGTIFLDEIGEMPLELQAKLLRVLQEGEFERLGSSRTIKVDVRVIASTSRDLKEEVRKNRFREDLYYRLNVFPVSLPPLRMRSGDIPQLVHYFIDRYARKIGRQIKSIPKETMKTLQEYSWPGNIRELEHVIERAVITSTGQLLHLAEGLEHGSSETKDWAAMDLATMEREHILKVLRETGWKINGEDGAAAMLRIHPSTLRFRMNKLGIKRT